MTEENRRSGENAASLAELARTVGGTVIGDESLTITGAAPFDAAEESELTLAVDSKYLKRLDETRAGAIIVPKGIETPGRTLLAVANPGVAFAHILQRFHPRKPPEDAISPDARVGDNFRRGEAVSIGPFVVIGRDVTVGSRVRIHPGVVIEDGVTMGDDVEISPNVTVRERCVIGSRVLIHSGTVIGGDGFGFAPDGERYHKIPHTGIVRIGDDVEIGALNAIDRATFGETRIENGVKTDNLIHIAHNVVVGENTVLVAQVGVSGSTTIGKNAILAGQVGVTGHLKIGDRVTIGAQSGIAKSIPDGETVSGSPEMPHKLWLRVVKIIPMLPELKKRIFELEKRLRKIEGDN